ncbi:hypothetical protein [Streptomyces sp. NPDC047014]|uniref:hypothetical protein n=1 Tax=Streptomyces sp. NPDC047014 TaxID=3155736 RepID=UPI0033D9EBE2
MSGCDRTRVEAALEGFFEVARSWEFELAWKLCWLEREFAEAGWKGGPPASQESVRDLDRFLRGARGAEEAGA